MSWMNNCLEVEGICLKEFGRKFVQKGDTESHQQNEWAKGKHTISANTVMRICKNRPDLYELYFLPLWPLLYVKSIYTKKKLNGLISTLTSGNPMSFWSFPNDWTCTHDFDQLPAATKRISKPPTKEMPDWYFPNDGKYNGHLPLTPPLDKNDSEHLYQRGDIFGFIAILALIREAETSHDMEACLKHLRNAFKALPSIGRLRPFKNYWRSIGTQLSRFQFKHSVLMNAFLPNWEIMEKQVNGELHITKREHCNKSPYDGRFMLPEEPLILPNY